MHLLTMDLSAVLLASRLLPRRDEVIFHKLLIGLCVLYDLAHFGYTERVKEVHPLSHRHIYESIQFGNDC
jgi:hypothetical protein